MVQSKIFMLVILFVLPIYSQIENCNGWSYAGAWGTTDTVNTVMRIEEGPSPSDSVMRINSYGWTVHLGTPPSDFYVVQNSFGKFKLARAQYPWPDTILINFRVLSTTNTYLLVIAISLLDTAEGGCVGYLYGVIKDIPQWQIIKLIWSIPLENKHVTMLGMDFACYSYDSAYVGLEVQANNLQFVYKNGDTILVDPFQYTWPSTVGIISEKKQTPSEFALSQNYPNPFNPSTQITYFLPTSGGIKLSVYNLLGQEVATLVDIDQSIGQHSVTFDASRLASGTYLYVLSVDNKIIDRKKMLFLK